MISPGDLDGLSPAELERVLATLEQIETDRASGRVPFLCDDPDCDGLPHRGRPGPHARQHQRPPLDDEWDVWMALAGRGFGKTRMGAEWAWRQAKVSERGALVGPTAADARDILVEGESGIMACAPPTFRPVYEPSKRRLTYPNGAMQTVYSADEPDRLRGPQHHYAWLDELAAWRRLQATWDMLQMGMRLGDHPQICITTTPRPLPIIKLLLKDPMVRVVRGSTYDNLHNLAPTFRRAVVAKYEGTTLGRQELYADVLDDLPGALIPRAAIERNRVETCPELQLIGVAVDPAGTGAADETGIIAGGRGIDNRDYVTHDRSGQYTPRQAALTAWRLLREINGDVLIYEENYGKAWVKEVFQSVWREHWPHEDLPMMRPIWASIGKKLRAQPVAMRYEQDRVSHVGTFPEMEDQCVVAGTLVETERGHLPIESVRAGDRVMTRAGWAPVKWAGQTGVSSHLVGIQVVDCVLWTTQAHPVWDESQGRFVRADSVGTTSRLRVRRSPASTVIQSPGTVAGGTLRPTATTGTPEARCCTEPSGPLTTNPFLPGIRSTMLTMTRGTTRLRTSRSSLPVSTGRSIPTPRGSRRGRLSSDQEGARPSGQLVRHAPSPVHGAGTHSKPQVSGLRTVHGRVGARRTTPVYNLTVADGYPPEFYANGILVHNCTTWIPEEDPNSPDRLDAMVHLIMFTMKRFDKGASQLVSPHGLRPAAGGVHPLEAARIRRAQKQAEAS